MAVSSQSHTEWDGGMTAGITLPVVQTHSAHNVLTMQRLLFSVFSVSLL